MVVRHAATVAAVLCLTASLYGQTVHVRDAKSEADMPAPVDSNSPAYWKDGQLHILNSTGDGPMRSDGTDQFHLSAPQSVGMRRQNPWPAWIESVWVDPDGQIFAWYHQEHHGVCPGTDLAMPQIGAAVSYDGGNSYTDLGVVLSSGDPTDCWSQNGYFAGGHGDFSVIPDRGKKYFYFYFTNYGGAPESQGIAVARMLIADRLSPQGKVWKHFGGRWAEPGIGGRVTPVLPAATDWQSANTDSFWGPSIHFNTYLDRFVMLLNHSCCSPGFPQEGIYIAYSTHIGEPAGWSQPEKIMDNSGWYPQVLGQAHGTTSSTAGRTPRLYIYGHSWWELVFEKPQQLEMPPGEGLVR